MGSVAEIEVVRLRQLLCERDAELSRLRDRIAACKCASSHVLDTANADLVCKIAAPAQFEGQHAFDGDRVCVRPTKDEGCSGDVSKRRSPSALTRQQIARYSRHLLIPEIGVRGQTSIIASSVLVIGAGGLGCPVVAAAGIGRIGIADYDHVELSNLQRQIGHSEQRVNMPKAESLAERALEINSTVQCVSHCMLIDCSNALELFSKYPPNSQLLFQFELSSASVYLPLNNCSDNPATRYLINDACVLTKRPLVSGSAVRLEGQLSVYNYKGGPCYRCMFPTPPPPAAVANCGDAGVLGAITGIMGCIQALEVVKIASRGNDAPRPSASLRTAPEFSAEQQQRPSMDTSYSQKMLLFDGCEGTFRQIRLRGRRPDCAVCGEVPTITSLSSFDYSQKCGPPTDKTASVRVLEAGERVTCAEFASAILSPGSDVIAPLVLDVRSHIEREICALAGSLHVPLAELQTDAGMDRVVAALAGVCRSPVAESATAGECGGECSASVGICEPALAEHPHGHRDVFVVCRRGNDSQLAVRLLRDKGVSMTARDVRGGLDAWASQIDTEFPTY